MIVITIIGIGVYLHFRESEKLSLKQIFVIGVITERNFHSKGSASIKYTYSLGTNKYSIESYEGSNRVKIGEKYLVTIPEGYEDEGIILLDSPVPDEAEAPLTGWDVKPSFNK